MALVRFGATGTLKKVDCPNPGRRACIGPGNATDPNRAAISFAPGDSEVGLAEFTWFNEQRHGRGSSPGFRFAKYEVRHTRGLLRLRPLALDPPHRRRVAEPVDELPGVLAVAAAAFGG